MKSTFYTRIGKRWIDVIVSLAGLLLLSPLLLAVAIAVNLSSPGGAFFSQTRTGRFGRPFRIFKFRTMTLDPAGPGSLLTAAGDPRITPLGRWLRKIKLDELPQLFNVLLGHMSLVGPRPEVPLYTARYSPRQKQILLVRPGITSPQINFDEEELLAASPDKEKFYLTTILPAKLELDHAYCDNIGFLEDRRIVLQTTAQVVRRMFGLAEFVPRRPAFPTAHGTQEPADTAIVATSRATHPALPQTPRHCDNQS